MELKVWLSWSGDAAKLAADADRLLADHVASKNGAPTTVRVVRDYQARGILVSPERQGQRAIYGSRQLLQLAAARILVNDGWPLAKIAETIGSMSTTGLAAIIGGQSEPHRVSQSAGRKHASADTERAASTGSSSVGDFAATASTIGKLRSDLRNRRRRLDLPSEASGPVGIVEFTISAECRVQVHSRLLGVLTFEQAVDLGQAIAATLVIHVADRSATSAARTQRR